MAMSIAEICSVATIRHAAHERVDGGGLAVETSALVDQSVI
jgi:hypothetical protein